MARREIPEPLQFVEHMPGVIRDLSLGSELTCAVVVAAYLEGVLGSTIKEHFVDKDAAGEIPDPIRGHLGPFMARVVAAQCLGVVNEEVSRNLSTIAKIRNQFAHSLSPVGFGDAEVEKLCRSLHTVEGRMSRETVRNDERASRARRQYIVAVLLLGDEVHGKGIHLARGRKKSKG